MSRPVPSSLALGTASFWRGLGRAAVTAVVEAAVDEGITHLDTAPMYGLGHAEALLGDFLSRHRDRVTVTTKVGILPPPAAARRVLPGRLLRGPLGPRTDFGVAAVRTSFERSLRALRTDYVDILLLHECAPEHVTEDIVDFLHGCVANGAALAIGTASSRASTDLIAARWDPFPGVVQFPWTALGGDVTRDGKLAISHSSVKTVLDRVWRRPDEARRWSESLGVDCTRSDVVAGLALAMAQRDNPAGVTLFSSRSPDRIRANRRLAATYAGDDELLATAVALLLEGR